MQPLCIGVFFMAFTQAEIDSLKAAYLELAAGTRVVSVTIAGKTIQYHTVDMKSLKDVIDNMQVQTDAVAGTTPLRTYAQQGGRTS